MWILIFSGAASGGTISGKALFKGAAPEPKPVDMAADPTCAGLHPEGFHAEDTAVNPNGTLKNVFVYVKQGLEGKKFDAPKEAVLLDQQGCWYHPHVFGIQVNQPLEIRNSDSTLHNVHAVPSLNKEFNLGMPIQGMTLKKTFAKPEVMARFKCDVHPWMSAYAGVLEHPFFATTDEQGAFEIKGLPAGNYVVEAWHEVYGTKQQTVSVGETGAAEANFEYAAA